MMLLNTHALIWMDADEPSLGRLARRAIRDAWAEGRVGVSAISFWECTMLHQLGRIELPVRPDRWRQELLAAGLQEWALTGDVAVLHRGALSSRLLQCAQLHARHRQLAPDHGTRVQVVVARPIAERVQIDMAGVIARERIGAARVEERFEAQFVVRLGRH
jgi:PIN domain nuclease of toxin-antitoxin system